MPFFITNEDIEKKEISSIEIEPPGGVLKDISPSICWECEGPCSVKWLFWWKKTWEWLVGAVFYTKPGTNSDEHWPKSHQNIYEKKD